jgi:hypothetical protein
MKRTVIAITSIILILVFTPATAESHAQKHAVPNECGSNLNEEACRAKTQQDIALAIRSNPKECRFEPDWRPTNFREQYVLVKSVVGSAVTISTGGESRSIPLSSFTDTACKERDGRTCPPWFPKIGKEYHASITNRPEYLNQCLHRVLRAERDICIDSGRVTGRNDPSICFSLPPDAEKR